MSEKTKLEEEIIRLQNRLHQVEENLNGKPKEADQFNLSCASDYPHQIFIEKMLDGAVIISKLGLILYANPSFVEMVGSSKETVIGKSILDFLSNTRRAHFLEHLDVEKKKMEVEFFNESKNTLTVSLSITKINWNGSENFYLIANDVSEIKRKQNYIDALESIKNVFLDISSASITFKLVIDFLKKYFDWDLIIVWNRKKDLQNLHCFETANVQGGNFEVFLNKTRELDQTATQLLEHVWASHRP